MDEDRRLWETEAEGPAEEPLLSPQRSFVVQFREVTTAAPEGFRGRVEHIVSGHAARFHSPKELVSFLKRFLADLETSDSHQ